MSKEQVDVFTKGLGVPGSAEDTQPFLDSLKPTDNSQSGLNLHVSGRFSSDQQYAKTTVHVPAFNDLAKQLDPMLPQTDYDAIRTKYFTDHVLPQVSNPMSIPELHKQFMAKTERPALLDAEGRYSLRMSMGANAAYKALIAPVSGLGPEGKQAIAQADSYAAEMHRIAAREGISPTLPEGVGTLLGAAPPIMLAEAGVGPLAASLIGTAGDTAATIALAHKVLKGGMAFATYEAASAQDGHRMQAGIRGFVWGAVPSLALGLPAYLRSSDAVASAGEASVAAKDVMEGRSVAPKVDQSAAAKIDADITKVKAEGRPNVYLDFNAKPRGAYALMTDRVGKPVMPPISLTTPGDAISKINMVLDSGGSLDTIQAHPEHTGNAIEVLRAVADKRGFGYDNSLVLDLEQKVAKQASVEAFTKAGIPRQRNFAGLQIDEPLWTSETKPEEAVKLIQEHVEAEKLAIEKAGRRMPTADINKRRIQLMQIYERTTGGSIEADELVTKLKDQGVPAQQVGKRVVVPTVSIQIPKPPSAGYIPSFRDGELLWDANMPSDKVARNIEDYIGGSEAKAVGRVLDPAVKSSMRETLWQQYAETAGKTNQEFEQAQAIGDAAKIEGQAPKMTYQQAKDLAVRMGKDPEKADLDAIMHLGEEEIQRLEDVVKTQKGTKVDAASSVTEEGYRLNKGERPGISRDQLLEWANNTAARTAKADAPSLLELMGYNPAEHEIRDIKLEQGDGVVRAIIPRSTMEFLKKYHGISDFDGLTNHNWQELLHRLGVPEAEWSKLNMPNSPMIVFKEGVHPSTVWHEEFHTGLVNAETNPLLHVDPAHRATITQLAAGISENWKQGYGGMHFEGLVDEAYTYASQAIKHNDQELLQTLGDWDTDKDSVRKMVNSTSENILKASESKLDSPGVRNFQTKLKDVIRRSSDNVFDEANKGLDSFGERVGYDADSGSWIVPDNEGQLRAFPTLNELWDHILASDISNYTSDPSFDMQTRGVRGAFTAGPPPGKRLPQPDFPLSKNDKGIGWTSINGWFRPFLGWVATLDRQANEAWSAKGMRLPIFDAVKKLDNGVREGEPWLGKWAGKFADEIKNFSHAKQKDLFELLTQRPLDAGTQLHPGQTMEQLVTSGSTYLNKLQAKFKMSDAEMASVGRLIDHYRQFEQETNIPVLDYLRQYYPRLKSAQGNVGGVPGWTEDLKSAGWWNRAVLEGRLDPHLNDAGVFTKWVMDEGYKKLYINDALDRLQKVVDTKTPEGNYVLGPARYPLVNHINYMKGIPDTTSRALIAGIGQFQNFMLRRFADANKFLPEGAKLPTELSTPSTLINRLILFSYAGGLAARPAIAVRDALQVFITGMPVIGGSTFTKGMTRAFTREGWMFAENSGALLRKASIAETYGDIFNEIPMAEKGVMQKATKLAQMTLGLSRTGNNIARAIVFNGAYGDAFDAVEAFRAGKITSDQFLKDSHAWFLEPQIYSRILGKLSNKEFSGMTSEMLKDSTHGLAKEIALELTDATQWAYRRGTQPAMLKTGIGRMLGQYGSWPLNYAEFMVGMWAATNYAASKAMEGIGADSSKWLWTSPASYTGGPQLDLVKDIATGLGSDEEAASARARVLRYPLNFVPGNVAARSIITALENNEDLSIGGKGFIRAMGFKPLEQIHKDPDYLEWALEQSGVTADPSRGRK